MHPASKHKGILDSAMERAIVQIKLQGLAKVLNVGARLLRGEMIWPGERARPKRRHDDQDAPFVYPARPVGGLVRPNYDRFPGF